MGHQLAYITVAIILPLIFVLICCVTAFATSRNRSWCFKLMIWGAFSIVLISPILSFAISQASLVITNDGWVGLGILMLSFEVTEAVSILLFFIGLVGCMVKRFKNKPVKSKPQSTET